MNISFLKNSHFLKQPSGQRQIRDTLRYLNDYGPIEVKNHRGHSFKLAMEGISQCDKLVLYYPDDKLPTDYLKIKYHHSSTAGIIHLISAVDYLGICRTFITPTEVHDYLTFRENLCDTCSEKLENIPEQGIVGQYLAGAFDMEPDTGFIDYLMSLKQERSEWDMSGIVRHFQDSIATGNPPIDYYKIITEIAKLKRSELKEYKIRFMLAVEKARKSEVDLPYRIAVPRTGCGFVFVPTTSDLKENRIVGLKNLTYAHKYDLKLITCVGVSFLFEANGFFRIDWCYLSFPWKYDPEFEKKLKENNPFRKVKTYEAPPYSFR
jgi:hypothetical protein